MSVNLCTNGTFEVDLTGWTIAGATSITRSTAQFNSGVASMLAACDSADDGASFTTITSGFQRGSRILSEGWIRLSAIAEGRIGWNELDAGGGYLRTKSSRTAGIAANTWTKITLDTSTNIDCHQIAFFIGCGAPHAAECYIDDVGIFTSTADVGWLKG